MLHRSSSSAAARVETNSHQLAMPKYTTPARHRPFERHFPPLTKRSAFRRESLLVGVPLTMRTEFPSAEVPLIRRTPGGQKSLPPGTPPKVLVKKPQGEVSRLSRGGYNLEQTLGWSKTDYSAVQKGIRELAKSHLDMRFIVSEQLESKLRTVFLMAKESFPVLLDYEGDWVCEDFLSTMLKNSSDRHKRTSLTDEKKKSVGKRWKDRQSGADACGNSSNGNEEPPESEEE